MKLDDARLKEILLKENYITQEDVENGEKNAKTHHLSFVDFLFTQQLITRELLGQAIAESFEIPFRNLDAAPPLKELVLKLPAEVAVEKRAVLIDENEEGVTIATDQPDDATIVTAVQTVFPGKKVTIVFAMADAVTNIFRYYRKPLDTRFMAIIEGGKKIAPEILDEIFDDAFTFRASDIHFEPQEHDVTVRFRIDGDLRDAGHLTKEIYENILNRIKVMSQLRIDEHYAAQDGSIRYFLKGTMTIDMRISILPTIYGEKIVIRVLAKYVQGFTVVDLGLSQKHKVLLETAANKPFGMILVAGPTGSGKSTTLYALLKTMNDQEVNITTIEDPVEYRIDGINQIQVNSATNLTFAKGLRSIVRQDPDIILVGEIRDQETAEIAVNAALTGHMLLSTFHANDAATGIPRLLDMGVEPFLLSSTLELVIAQRLARRICQRCRYSRGATFDEVKAKLAVADWYFEKGDFTLYAGKGCDACGHSGFAGRTALYEMISITPEMEELMLHHPSAKQIWELARKQGAMTLFEDGVEKVKNGVTTLEELLRVAAPPDSAPVHLS